MKNFAKIFTAIVVAFAAYSCVADATEDLGVQLGGGEGQTTITLSFEELTKVQLGEKNGEVYPLYWSNGDQISVNGVASSELAGVSDKNAKEVSFTVAGEVAYPMSILFPATEGEAVDGCYPVTFPAVQTYTEGNVDPKAVVMYGYVAEQPAEGEVAASAALNHLTGVLQINVTGDVTLTSLSVEARGGNISGTYNVDCATGLLTATDNASSTVTMNFGEGLTLNADEATPIYVTVPAGIHGAVWVTLRTAEDKMTVKFNSIGKPINAGVVREFKEFPYTPNTVEDESDVYEIDSVDALIAFADEAANLTKFNKVVLAADLTWPSDQAWTPIEGFGAFEFDGNDKTITGLNAPLFNETNAYIHNLTLANVVLNVTDNGNSGAFARRMIGGSLVNCSATGASTIDCAAYNFDGYKNGYCSYAHGGLVGHIVGTTVDHCTNEIDVNVVNICAPVEGQAFKAAVGGITGCYSNTVSLTNLVNKGEVIYSGTTQTGTLYLSGIVGRSTEHPEHYDYVDHVAALANCTNYGLISNVNGSVTTGGLMLSGIIGSIVTTSGTEITATNLINEAADDNGVVAKGTSAFVNVAGIIANSCQAHLNGCENRTTVGIGSGATVEHADVAGILVGLGRNGRVIENCHNKGGITIAVNITIKTPEVTDTVEKEVEKEDGSKETVTLASGVKIYNVNVGGIVANTTMNCTIKNCSNTKTILSKHDVSGANLVLSADETSNNKKQTYTGGFAMGGICGYVDDSTTIENCTNSGKIQQEKAVEDSNPTYIRLGGIVGMNEDAKKCTINNCINDGVVAYTAKKLGMVDIGVAGIIGYASHGATINSCTNNVAVGGAGYAMKLMGFGGIVGTSSRGSVKVIGCKNYGTITQSQGTLKKTAKLYGINYGNGLGGIVGFAQSIQEISGCENWGQITIKNSNVGSDNDVSIYVGGIIGAYVQRDASDASGSRNKSIKNCTNCVDLTFAGNAGRYFAGGVIGYLSSYENAYHYWEEISGLKNIANLDFSGVGTSTGKNSDKYPPLAGYGGIVGYAEFHKGGTYEKDFVPFNKCTFYGDMIIGTESGGINSRVQPNCGVLLGSERVATGHIFTKSYVGGIIATGGTTTIPGTEGTFNEETEEWVGGTPDQVVRNGYVLHENNNWLTWLYKGGLTAAEAATDVCNLLTAKPAN